MKAPRARITKIFLKNEAEGCAIPEIWIKCGTIIMDCVVVTEARR